MSRPGAGQEGVVAETPSTAGPGSTGVLDVREERDGEVCRLALAGELTEAARRPWSAR